MRVNRSHQGRNRIHWAGPSQEVFYNPQSKSNYQQKHANNYPYLQRADQSLEQALSEQYSDPGGFEPKPSLAASIMKSREEDSLKEALEIDTAQDRLRENLKKVQLNKAEPILSSGVSREYAYAAYDRTAS